MTLAPRCWSASIDLVYGLSPERCGEGLNTCDLAAISSPSIGRRAKPFAALVSEDDRRWQT
jgi:hypothetical protein